MLKECEQFYREYELPKVRASIKEWQNEFPFAWRREKRREFLLTEIEITRNEFFDACKELARIGENDGLTYWHEQAVLCAKRKLRRLSMEAKIWKGVSVGVSAEKISKARLYPIGNFVRVEHGKALCPFHNDHHPSMDVRENFYYCYVCSAKGDVIDLVMKLKEITFRKAVEILQ